MLKLTPRQLRALGRESIKRGKAFLSIRGKRMEGFFLLKQGRTMLLQAEIITNKTQATKRRKKRK